MLEELRGNVQLFIGLMAVMVLVSVQAYFWTHPVSAATAIVLPPPVDYILLSVISVLQIDSCYDLLGGKNPLSKNGLVGAIMLPYIVFTIWITLIN